MITISQHNLNQINTFYQAYELNSRFKKISLFATSVIILDAMQFYSFVFNEDIYPVGNNFRFWTQKDFILQINSTSKLMEIKKYPLLTYDADDVNNSYKHTREVLK